MLNGRLYVMGGRDSNKLQVLEMTEENGLAWTVKADLPANRNGAASVVHDGRIWVMGGCVAGEGPTASVLTYDAEADTWATGPSLPSPCANCRAATIDGGIHLNDARPQTFQYKNAAWSEVQEGVENMQSPVLGCVLLG